ncbi:MAG: hypothetical protein GWP06_14330 [Actinobacteria bacterium]|nr:hypothetical protein [Actinomycetota bacterium]
MIKEFFDMPKMEKFVGKNFRFLSPNTWTTVSLLIAVAAFFAVVYGQNITGVILFIISTLCDLVDGKVARYTNTSSKLGAFWDGTVDRFVDGLLILCFFFLDFPVPQQQMALILFALLFTTLLPPFIVAYANHRGAVPDPTEKVIWRFAFRIEYVVFYITAIGLHPVNPMISYYLIWAGLVLMSATVVQSIYLVFVKSKLYT